MLVLLYKIVYNGIKEVEEMAILTVTDVAERLQLDPETIRRYINRGDIVAYKIGKEWRIEEDDLMEFIRRKSNVGKEDK